MTMLIKNNGNAAIKAAATTLLLLAANDHQIDGSHHRMNKY
jgi:hypothetical protein